MAKKKLSEEEKQKIRDMDASVTVKEGKLLSEKNFFEKLEYITGVITALRDIVPNTKEGLRILREGKNSKKRTGDDSSDKYYGGNVYPRKPKSGQKERKPYT